MNPFRNWLNLRRAEKQLAAFRAGYAWAAGVVLRGEESPLEVEAQIASATYFGAYTPFDKGAEQALERLRHFNPSEYWDN